jgi:hypothetical protein
MTAVIELLISCTPLVEDAGAQLLACFDVMAHSLLW